MTRRTLFTTGLLLWVVAWAPSDVPKEHVHVQLKSINGAPTRVRLITRGLILMSPPAAGGRQPWQIVTTFTTPVEIDLAGVGEADLRVVDSTAALVAEVTQVRATSLPGQRLSGQGFRVSRTTYTEPFGVTTLELPGHN